MDRNVRIRRRPASYAPQGKSGDGEGSLRATCPGLPGTKETGTGPGRGGGDRQGMPNRTWYSGRATPGRGLHPEPLLTLHARGPGSARLRRGHAPLGVRCQLRPAAAPGLRGIWVSCNQHPSVSQPPPPALPLPPDFFPIRRPSAALPFSPCCLFGGAVAPLRSCPPPARARTTSPRNALS